MSMKYVIAVTGYGIWMKWKIALRTPKDLLRFVIIV